MKKAIRDAWVQSLRSGLYPQARGALCRREQEGYCFCALGVLADVVDPKGWETGDLELGMLREYGGYIGLLPDEMYDEIGLPWTVSRRVVELNDDEKKTFPEIASWIEENIPVEDAA